MESLHVNEVWNLVEICKDRNFVVVSGYLRPTEVLMVDFRDQSSEQRVTENMIYLNCNRIVIITLLSIKNILDKRNIHST